MAAKYFCDGCDRELPEGGNTRITVNVNDGSITKSGGQYDLCKRCASRLYSDANPKQWMREEKRQKTA